MPTDLPQAEGGKGGNLYHSHRTRLREERRALLSGWALTAEQRKVMLQRQIDAAIDPATPLREARQCMKVILEADVINVSRERLDLQEEIAARKEQGAAERIGLTAIVQALVRDQEKEAKVVEAKAQEQCQEGNAAESGDDSAGLPSPGKPSEEA